MKQNIKTALITGSARRIGKYLAISLAGQGYNLAISYRNSKSAATELKEYLTSNFDIKSVHIISLIHLINYLLHFRTTIPI